MIRRLPRLPVGLAVLFCAVASACQSGPATQLENQVPLTRNSDNTFAMMARVDAAGPYRVIFDTGAETSAIDKSIASQIGIGDNGIKMDLHGLFSTGTGQYAPNHSMQIGPFIGPFGLVVLDDNRALTPHGASGIAGMDLLQSLTADHRYVTMDFTIPAIGVHSGLTNRQRRKQPKWFPLKTIDEAGSNLLMFDITLDGINGVAVLDSGLSMSVINTQLAQGLARRGRAEFNMLVDVNGFEIAPVASVSGELNALGFNWDGVKVVVYDAPAFKALGLDTGPAMIMGANFIQELSFVLDVEARRLAAINPKRNNGNFGVGEGVYLNAQ